MAAALYLRQPLVEPFARSASSSIACVGLALLVGGGIIVYRGRVFVTGAYTLAELRSVLRRKPKPKAD